MSVHISKIINKKSVICTSVKIGTIGIMLARNKSSRLPNKNMRDFIYGMSLFEHVVRKAIKLKLDELLIISNDDDVFDICVKYGIKYIREPERLVALDDSWQVIEWAIKFAGIPEDNILICLPVTAPLRDNRDVKEALKLYESNIMKCDSVVSMCKCTEPPEWAFEIEDGYIKQHDFPMTSQELKDYYYLNGAIYISTVATLLQHHGFFGPKVIPYIMPHERSVDIDELFDFELAQFYAKRNKHVSPFVVRDRK